MAKRSVLEAWRSRSQDLQLHLAILLDSLVMSCRVLGVVRGGVLMPTGSAGVDRMELAFDCKAMT